MNYRVVTEFLCLLLATGTCSATSARSCCAWGAPKWRHSWRVTPVTEKINYFEKKWIFSFFFFAEFSFEQSCTEFFPELWGWIQFETVATSFVVFFNIIIGFFQPNLALFQSILLSYIVVIAFDFLYWLWVFSLWWTCFFDWINRILEKKRLPFWTKKCGILVDDDDGDQICCGWTNRSAASTATPAGRWRRWPRPSATPPATRRRCCRWPNSTSSSTGVSTPAPTTTTTPTPTATATPTSTT